MFGSEMQVVGNSYAGVYDHHGTQEGPYVPRGIRKLVCAFALSVDDDGKTESSDRYYPNAEGNRNATVPWGTLF